VSIVFHFETRASRLPGNRPYFLEGECVVLRNGIRTGIYFVIALLLLNSTPALAKSYLLAQSDPDEAYDPFIDYSEFDEASDEEADINFFRHGRFFTVGLVGGQRDFTGNFRKTYKAAPTFGILLTYFFDFRFALTFGFLTGDHAVNFTTVDGVGNKKAYDGNVSFTYLNFDLKYYFNTQNITRGLADLNPYMLGGFSQFYRTYTISGTEGFARDAAMGVDLGGGLEVPLMRKKAFFGVQGAYHYVNFADESKEFVNQGNEKLSNTISGDIYDVLFILGINF
jgi:hypothetical protein